MKTTFSLLIVMLLAALRHAADKLNILFTMVDDLGKEWIGTR